MSGSVPVSVAATVTAWPASKPRPGSTTAAPSTAAAVLTFAYDTSTVNDAPGHPGRGQVKPGAAERTLAAIRELRAR